MIGLRRIKNIIADNGDYQEIFDIDVMLDSLEKIFSIMLETYPFDPEFGSNLFRYLHEPFDDINRENIEYDVRNVMAEHIPGLKIKDLKIRAGNDKSFILDIIVEFQGMSRNAKFLVGKKGYVSLIKDD
ncbi:GPW/gp25 family protein [Candidatus Pacearchaeota archaeon]|nr:GPW/gp25 family protein [Candidatus Pacearchaeota archaeon]